MVWTSQLEKIWTTPSTLILKKYWKIGNLGTSFQSFLDANEIIEESSLDDNEKENERAAILAARKEAFGDQFKYYPPWR